MTTLICQVLHIRIPSLPLKSLTLQRLGGLEGLEGLAPSGSSSNMFWAALHPKRPEGQSQEAKRDAKRRDAKGPKQRGWSKSLLEAYTTRDGHESDKIYN